MKQTQKNQGFFVPIGYVAVVAVLIIIGLIVYLVYAAGTATKNSTANNTKQQIANNQHHPKKPKKKKIQNFYDCYELNGEYTPPADDGSTRGVCVHNGKRYVQPATFTDEDVRGSQNIPPGARSAVYSIASDNYHACQTRANQENALVPTTDVLSVYKTDFVYIGVSCDQGYRDIIWHKPDGTWHRISHTTNVVTCDTVKKYQIPAQLFYKSSALGNQDAQCLLKDGTTRTITE
jgi:hypothetical protein